MIPAFTSTFQFKQLKLGVASQSAYLLQQHPRIVWREKKSSISYKLTD